LRGVRLSKKKKAERARAAEEVKEHRRKVRVARRRGRLAMALENVGWGLEPAVTVRLEARTYEPAWKTYRRLPGWQLGVEVVSVEEAEELLAVVEMAVGEWVRRKVERGGETGGEEIATSS